MRVGHRNCAKLLFDFIRAGSKSQGLVELSWRRLRARVRAAAGVTHEICPWAKTQFGELANRSEVGIDRGLL